MSARAIIESSGKSPSLGYYRKHAYQSLTVSSKCAACMWSEWGSMGSCLSIASMLLVKKCNNAEVAEGLRTQQTPELGDLAVHIGVEGEKRLQKFRSYLDYKGENCGHGETK